MRRANYYCCRVTDEEAEAYIVCQGLTTELRSEYTTELRSEPKQPASKDCMFVLPYPNSSVSTVMSVCNVCGESDNED